MIKSYDDMHACRLSAQPGFEQLPEKARKLYYAANGITGTDGVCKTPRALRMEVGAGDGDVRALIRHGYLLPLESGAALVIRCPFVRQWIEEYIEQYGHTPTVDEIEKGV